MALNLTPRRRFGVALGVVLATVSTGLIGFAGSAGAHTNRSSAECVDGVTTLTVDLTAYSKKKDKKNTVKITDNGATLHDEEFSEGYQDKFEAPGDIKHTFTVDVKAWDDPQGDKGWSFAKEIVVEACVEQTTPPEETSTSETTPPVETTTEETVPPVPSTSSEAPPVPTTTSPTVAPVAEEEPLAETGASIALPLGIAGVLIVGGVVALFVVRRRSKA